MKKTIIKLCKIVPIVLLGCFVVSVVTGYARYSSTLNSAPFSVWVLVDALYLVAPSLILFVIGIVLEKKVKVRSAIFWIYIAGLVGCSLTATVLIWNPFKNGGELRLSDRIEISNEFHIPEIGNASGDFDGDGKTERYSLTFGPTSGLFTVRFSVYEEGVRTHFSIFHVPYRSFDFASRENGEVYVSCEEWKFIDGEDTFIKEHQFEISFEEDRVVLEENGVFMEYWGEQGLNSRWLNPGGGTE